MLRTLYGDHDCFESAYFKKFPGYYYTGDGTVISITSLNDIDIIISLLKIVSQ